jgi:Sulfotransferase family
VTRVARHATSHRTVERDVIFVGGTPFSGADAVASLLARCSGVTRAPSAARFHSDPWGIPALLHGRMGLDDFTERLRDGEIAERVPRERLDGALAGLRAGYDADPLGACRELFWALIGEPGDGPLVEASPGNLLEAHTLTRLVPRARFVHVVRDGRDAAATAVESDAVGVHELTEALEWWADQLREIERGVRGEEDGAAYAIPDERLAVVVLDEVVDAGSDAVYAHLLDRLSLGEDGHVPEPSPPIDAAAIGRGRWRTQARGPARWRARRRYERAIDELEAEGNHAAPALRAAYDRLG